MQAALPWARRAASAPILLAVRGRSGAVVVRISAAALAVALAALAPASASGTTFARARAQLRAWHLRPAPLFPAGLPAAHHRVNVHLYTFSGMDYSIDFGAADNRDCHTVPIPSAWCVNLRRWRGPVFQGHLRTEALGVRRLWVGHRHVWFFEDSGGAGGWYMAWRQQGRTYAAWAWMARPRPALRRLVPFVQTLRLL